MLEIIVFAIACALGGYGIGRTLTIETIFERWMQKIVDFCFFPVDPEDHMVDHSGAVFYLDEDGSPTVLSEDGYRTDIWRPLALILGKVGDLLSCVNCLSAQSAFQLYIWSVLIPLSFLTLEVIGLFAVVGGVYMILDRMA